MLIGHLHTVSIRSNLHLFEILQTKDHHVESSLERIRHSRTLFSSDKLMKYFLVGIEEVEEILALVSRDRFRDQPKF